MPELYSFEDNNHFFIKFFLLDATLNLNAWGVTENARKANLDTFIGKPFVVTPAAGHPSANDGDELIRNQEEFRVGNIIEVGFDRTTHKAFGIAEITDEVAKNRIKSGEISFVSPSIVFNSMDVSLLMDGSSIVHRFEGAHVAGVKEPAYGMLKAQIKGQCSGDKVTCESELAMVQASKEGKTIKTFEFGEMIVKLANSPCVQDCIQAKSEKGITIDDQALAICFSECGESKSAILKKDKEPYKADKVNEPGKPDKACNKDQNLPCVNLEASIKAESRNKKAMTAQDEQDEEKKKMEEEAKAKAKAQDEEEQKKKDEESNIEEEEKKKEEATVKSLRAEIDKMKADAEKSTKDPLITSIIDAKVKTGSITNEQRKGAFAQLEKMSVEVLTMLSADYTKIATLSEAPKYPYSVQYSQASRDKKDDIDNLIHDMEMN